MRNAIEEFYHEILPIRWQKTAIHELAVNSSNDVRILMASIQAVRSITRVVFTAHANPALRATLSQDSA